MNPIRSHGLGSIQLVQLIFCHGGDKPDPGSPSTGAWQESGGGLRWRWSSPRGQEGTWGKVRRPYKPWGQGIEGKHFWNIKNFKANEKMLSHSIQISWVLFKSAEWAKQWMGTFPMKVVFIYKIFGVASWVDVWSYPWQDTWKPSVTKILRAFFRFPYVGEWILRRMCQCERQQTTVASSVIFLALVARTHAGHEGTRAFFLLSQPHKIK